MFIRVITISIVKGRLPTKVGAIVKFALKIERQGELFFAAVVIVKIKGNGSVTVPEISCDSSVYRDSDVAAARADVVFQDVVKLEVYAVRVASLVGDMRCVDRSRAVCVLIEGIVLYGRRIVIPESARAPPNPPA